MQVGGAGLAVMDDPKRGIQFGAEGLSIPLTAGGTQARAAKCRLGTYYARNPCLPEGGRSLFAKGESLKGTELLSLKVEHSYIHILVVHVEQCTDAPSLVVVAHCMPRACIAHPMGMWKNLMPACLVRSNLSPFQSLHAVQAYVADGPAEQWRLDGIVWQSQN